MRKRTMAAYSLLGLAVTAITLFFMLNMTNPSSSGPAGILVVLLLIYGFTCSLLIFTALVFGYIYRLIAPTRDEVTTLSERAKRSQHKMLVICGVLASTPIFMISLNSIGRMGFVDILLIAATEILAVFYVVKKL